MAGDAVNESMRRHLFIRAGSAGMALAGMPRLSYGAQNKYGGRIGNQDNIVTIPPLYDYHSHTSMYIAFSDCMTFWDTRDKNAAHKILKGLPSDKLTLILGWH